MRRLHRAIALAVILAAVAMLPSASAAQDEAAASADAAQPKPAQMVTLDVRGLDIDNLLQFYSRTFGLTVIKDPNLTGPVTIMCPEPVSRQAALDILNSVLEVRGFTSILRGSVLKIVPLSKAVQSDVGLSVGRTAPQQGDQVVTQIIPLRNADAAQLQSELAPLVSAGASLIANSGSNTLTVTDYASNIARLLQIIEQLDSEQASQVRVFPLTYARADEVAQILTQMFFAQPRLPLRTGAASPEWQRRLMGALAATSGGRSPIIGGPIGQVVADSRTNSVLVAASRDRIETIGEVIKSLDKPVKYEGTLNVVSLERANAQEVATALTQVLRARAGTQQATATRAATTTTQRRQTTRTTPSTRTQTRRSQAPAAEDPDMDRAGQAPAEGGPEGPPEAPAEGPYPEFRVGGLTQVTPARTSAGEIVNLLEAAGNVTVVAEPNTNSLIINAPPEYAYIIAQLARDLDKAPPQVLIEAIVAEVSLDKETKLGFEWTWTEDRHLGQSGATGVIGTGFGLAEEATGLRYAVTGRSLETLLHTLATDDRIRILSTPRIFTSNNREAEINISTQTPYVTSVRTTEVSETFSIDYLDVGVILRVTPQISPDGSVTMQVVQEANELLDFEQFGTNVRAPKIARRSAQATISVADGGTVILGGIIRDSVSRSTSKVPLLGDLPLLGSLFSRSTTRKEKSELMVFLTPRVVRTTQEASILTDSQRAQIGIPELHPKEGNKNGND